VSPILQPAKSGLHAVADDKLDPGEQASEKQADELHDHVIVADTAPAIV